MRKCSLRMAALPRLGIALVAVIASVTSAGRAPAAQTITYTYDELGRITAAAYDDTMRTDYLYDASGNILQKSTAPGPVAVPRENGLPVSFGLALVGPNPAWGTVRIGFQLPTASQVKIVIYNVSGRRLRVLVDALQPAGFHAAQWDRLDDQGRSVRSGLYFVRMEARDFAAARKLVVFR